MKKNLEVALLTSFTPALLIAYHFTHFEGILFLISALLFFSLLGMAFGFLSLLIMLRSTKHLRLDSAPVSAGLSSTSLRLHIVTRAVQIISMIDMIYIQSYFLAAMMFFSIVFSMIFVSMSRPLRDVATKIKAMQK